MATRTTRSASVPDESANISEEFDPFPHAVESAVFIDDWVKNQSGKSAESLGTFAYFARNWGWLADTPSGWDFKYSRWLQRTAQVTINTEQMCYVARQSTKE